MILMKYWKTTNILRTNGKWSKSKGSNLNCSWKSATNFNFNHFKKIKKVLTKKVLLPQMKTPNWIWQKKSRKLNRKLKFFLHSLLIIFLEQLSLKAVILFYKRLKMLTKYFRKDLCKYSQIIQTQLILMKTLIMI